MKYLTLTNSDCKTLTARFLDEGWFDIGDQATETGSGKMVDVTDVETVAESVRAALADTGKTDGDTFEARFAGALHEALSEVPLPVVDDPGFWRFLGLQHFWDFIMWREPGAFESGDPGRYLRYLDGNLSTECVLLRMYLRGQIALRDGSYELASALPASGDFWRSHLIRVRTGASPVVAQALIDSQLENRMTTNPLRAYAKRLNRLSTNVLLPVQTDADARAIIEELREV